MNEEVKPKGAEKSVKKESTDVPGSEYERYEGAELDKVEHGPDPGNELKTTSKEMTLEKLSDEQRKFYEEMGYMDPIKINGEVVGISKFLFTYGIVCGLDETGYSHRYCYGSALEAHEALIRWIMSGEQEPSGYITKK